MAGEREPVPGEQEPVSLVVPDIDSFGRIFKNGSVDEVADNASRGGQRVVRVTVLSSNQEPKPPVG